MEKQPINYAKLSPEFRKKLEELEKNRPENKQLQAISDIADMLQELLNVMDRTKQDSGKTLKELGAVLTDSRNQLQALNSKETPRPPDYATPIVRAVERVESALASEIAKINVRPEVNLPAPQVNVAAPEVNVPAPEVRVDLSKINAAIKAVPDAFAKAIKLIPQPEIPDNKPIIELLGEMRDWLESIEHQSRKQPLPGSIKVTNLDGTPIGGGGLTNTELRAAPVIVDADFPANYPLPASQEAILSSIDTTLEEQYSDDQLYYSDILTANHTITPASGKRISMRYLSVVPNPDNTAANAVTVKFAAATGNIFKGYATGGSMKLTGAVNEVLNITLTSAEPVSVTVRYKEVT